MTKENIFFDLDGTIINSMEGIFNSIHYATDFYNLERIDYDTLCTFIGPPLHASFQRVFNIDFELADKYIEKYREYYSKYGIFEFSLYDKTEEMLKILSENYNLYITTSKPEHYSKIILEKANILKYFKYISGSEKDKPDSSKKQVVTKAIETFNLNKNSCLLIGDTKFDGEGATQTGIDFYGVSFGFGSIEELKSFNAKKIFDKPMDIAEYFRK